MFKFIGVKLYEGVSVEGVEVVDGKVAGVNTNKGKIECEIFVNCAGQVSASKMFSWYTNFVYHWTGLLDSL